jgi:hypothetical protein
MLEIPDPRPERHYLVSVVSDRAQISELSVSLANTARKDWMTLLRDYFEMLCDRATPLKPKRPAAPPVG